MAIPPLKVTGNDGDVAVLNKWAQRVSSEVSTLQAQADETAVQSNQTAKISATAADTTPAPKANTFTITQGMQMIDGVGYAQLTIGYNAPNPLGKFAGTYLVVTGYHGNNNPVKVAEDTYTGLAGGAKTYTVNLDRTNEAVTFYLVSKNESEFAVSNWTGSGFPTQSIVLNGSPADGIMFTTWILDNPNFEASTALPVPGWSAFDGGILSYETSTQQSGKQSLKITAPNQFAGAVTNRVYKVIPGEQYKIAGYVKSDGTRAPYIVFAFFDVNGSQVGAFTTSPTTNTSWTFVTATGTVPGGAVSGQLFLENSTASAGTVWFDNIFLLRSTNLDDEIFDGIFRKARTIAHSSYKPTSNPLTAVDAGASATINIGAFTMNAGADILNYNSASITSLAYNTIYYIYLQDPYFAGGTPSGGYHATTAKSNAINGYDQLFVGSIRTPPGGGSQTVGNNDGGAGAQVGNTFVMSPTVNYVSTTGAWTPISLSTGGVIAVDSSDGDTSVGGGFTNPSGDKQIWLAGWPPFSYAWTSLILRCRTSAGSSGGTSTIKYSLDGGNTFTNIRSTAAGWGTTLDSVILSVTQSLSLVIFAYELNGNCSVTGYEVWLEGQF